MLSANLGTFDVETVWAEQNLPGHEVTVHRWTDETFPPRHLSMTPRLQAKLPKMFGWEMAPGAELYLWIDASFALQRDDVAAWFLGHLAAADFACFAHPKRSTIVEEHAYIKTQMAGGNGYLLSRYSGELFDEALAAILDQTLYIDDALYASGAFIYRDSPKVRDAMREWWFHTSRYLVMDQLALPYVLRRNGLDTRVLPGNIFKNPYLVRIRR